jgi:hypothetical protein
MPHLLRRVRPVAAVVLAAGLLLGVVPHGAAAATLGTFGTPTATSAFEKGVTFSQPVTVNVALKRAELLITSANAIGPAVIEVPAPATGATTLSRVLDPNTDGHILPNTKMVARWRLVSAADPTVVEVGPEVTIIYADDRFQWRSETGSIVRVHWYDGSEAFGKRALKIGEDGVAETSKLLGVTESEPIDFYIYADQEAFYDALGPGTRENVGGEAIAPIRTLFALIPAAQIDDAWVGIVIPHELTHLVFDTAADNAYHFPPRWLNEGVAVYQSEGYGAQDRSQVAGAARAGSLIPLEGLTGQFPTTGDRFRLAYAESVSAVDYLVRTYKPAALVSLINSYADGRTDDEAFKAAIGVDVATFGDAWLADLQAAAPTKYGPKPPAPGPVPAAWSGGAAAAPSPAAAGASNAAGGPAAPAPAAPVPSGGGGTVPIVLVVFGALALLIVAAVLVARGRRRAAEDAALPVDATRAADAARPADDAARPADDSG